MAGGAKRFWILGAVLVVVNVGGFVWLKQQSAGSGGRLRILNALPTQDVDSTDRFVLVFDEALPQRTPLGTPLDRAPFTVRPAVDGRWQWAAADRLEYILSRPLPPGRRFTISPTSELEQQLGRALIGQTEFKFETRPLAVTGCELHSADIQYANIRLHFNQPVDPNAVAERVTCTDTESPQALDITALTTEVGEKILLRVQRPQTSRLKVSIAASLTGAGGDLPLAEPWTGLLAVAPRFALLRSWISPPAFDDAVTVELGFSQELDRSAALPEVQLNPPVDGLHVYYSYGTELRLEGNFESGRRYTATVGGDLRSTIGEALGAPQSLAFEIPDRSPGVRFPHSVGRLTPGGNLTLDLETVNVAALEVRANRVHANNLAAHLRGEEPKATSRELLTRSAKLDGARNRTQRVAVDLAGLLEAPLGIYQIVADATDHNWTSDNAVVCVTDLGLTTKRERDGMLVWVTSLRTAEPAAGVEVAALSFNNQTLATGVTDNEGIARLTIPAAHPDGQAWLVTARRDDDLSFLLPERTAWMIDDVDQSGHAVAGAYDVLLYTERGVYRPGETVHLTGIIRDSLGNAPKPFPLNVRVMRPDGKRVADLLVQSDAAPAGDTSDTATSTAADTPEFAGRIGPQGVFQLTFPTAADARTGRYRFVATLPGDAQVLGEAEALVEAFVPVRIETHAEANKPHLFHDEELRLHASARYLFGQPAAGLEVAVAGEYRAACYQSARHPDFTFGDPGIVHEQRISAATGTLDDQGTADIALPEPDAQVALAAIGERSGVTTPDRAAPIIGRWEARLVATVTEPGGRSISTTTSTHVDVHEKFLGLRLPTGKVTPAGQPLNVELVCVTRDDQPAKFGPVELHLLRVEHDNVLERVDGRPVWKSIERRVAIATNNLEPDASSAATRTITFELPQPGRYRVQAHDIETGGVTQIEFDAVSDGDSAQSVALDHPERLELVLDRESYTPGDTAKVLVRSPFAGTLFVTLETERVVTHRVVAMTENTTHIELPLDPTLRGGAFVSALVVRPIDPSKEKWLPHRALGLARIKTDHTAAELPVELTAPAKAQPGDAATITVRAAAPTGDAAPAVVHVWAVDEGILLTTDYETPHPLQHFFAQRAAVVTTADAFGDLLPDHVRPADMTRIGAGDEGEGTDWDDAAARRRGTSATPARPPTIIWRSAATVGPDGTVTFETTLPEFTGELRFMAVAVAGDHYGAAESAATVAAPLLAEMAWPRAVAPGDRFEAPLKLFNTSAAPLDVALALQVTGPITVETLATPTVHVKPGEPATVWLSAHATGLGTAQIELRATAADVRPASSSASVLVRAAGPLHTEAQLARFGAGESLELPAPGGFLPESARTLISISRRPSVELRPAIEQLLDYPYGCVEQTTSRLLALLHAPDLLGATPEQPSRADVARDMIAAGVARLWSMQTRSGGLAYWSGDAQPNLWGSAYAGLFLTHARRAGFAIDESFSKDLADYLQKTLDRERDDALDDNMRALLCNVLAGFDRPPHGWLARLSERLDQLDIAGRAHLAAAWLAAGRRDLALAALPEGTPSVPVVATTGGRLTSAVQQDAALLDVLLELDPQHAWIPSLVQRLEAARKAGAWGSTLENAAALAALARYQTLAPDDAAFEGVVETAAGGRYPFRSDETATFELVASDFPLKLHSSGSGSVYASLSTEGLLSDAAVKEYDNRLSVRRAWTNAAGEEIDPARLRVGDLIYVDVAISSSAVDAHGAVENVAIVDLLPGGCEVENPRLATSATSSGPAGDTPDRVEFLDDRIVLFTPVTRSERHFRYLVRVVSAGAFALPPVQAACMYDTAYASVHGGGHVEISR